MLRKFTSRFLAGLAVAAATIVLSPTSAKSQQAAAAPAQTPVVTTAPATPQTTGGGELQKVTVTGYLVPHVGDGPQPVTSYDKNYMSKLGYTTVTDVLQTLPGATGNWNPYVTTGFGFSPGSASIALKALPPPDTLTLVDGLRFPLSPFPQESVAGAFSFVDINNISTAALDRVDILNDGGSATYGSDAVAGVVNLITKHDYNGAEISNYFGISSRGDDETYHGYALGGYTLKLSDCSNINVTAGIDFYDSSPIMQDDRPWMQEDSNKLAAAYPGHPIFPAYTGIFSDPSGTVYYVNHGSAPPITAANFSSTQPTNYSDYYNNMWYQLVPRESRLSGFMNLDYQVTDWLKLYDSFIEDRTEELSSYQSQGFYPPSSFNHGGVTVPSYNPYNPFGVPLTVETWNGNEFGPLEEDATITTLRNVVGATVQLPEGWFIDGSFTYGESDGTETQNQGFLQPGVQAALDGTLPGHIGQFFNPFVDEALGLRTNSAFYNDKQVVTGIWQDNRTDLVDWNVRFGGPLAHLDNGDLTAAGAFEYRSEDFIQNEDKYSKEGLVLDYQNTVGVLTNGRRHETSLAGELDIPIFGNKWSFPGLRTLDGVISYRWDNYSDFGNAQKPKFALRWKPFDDLTLRATYSEGFVAPSLSQLFGSPLPAETAVVDPVNPSAGEYTTISTTRGNPNLQPQTSYGYFVGGVWSPGATDPDTSWWKWANGFSAYMNWFQIDEHNLIGTLTPQEIVDLPGPLPGNFVVRDPATTLITDITSTYLNLGNRRTEGIDFGFTYNTKEYNWGKLELQLDATYIYYQSAKEITGLNANGSFTFEVENQTDEASYTNPDFKLLASIFYSKKICGVDTFRTGVVYHYTDSEADFNASQHGTDPNFQSDVAGTSYVHLIGSWNTFDWQISYEFGPPEVITTETPPPGYGKDGKRIVGEKAISPKPEGSHFGWRTLLGGTKVTFGINNVFDYAAPLSADWYQNYDYGVNNPIGRFFYFQIDKKF
jgi:iron complex outermembrane recepter protein